MFLSRHTDLFDFQNQRGYCLGYIRKDGIYVRYAMRTINTHRGRPDTLQEQRAMFRTLVAKIRHRHTLRGCLQYRFQVLRTWITRVKNRYYAEAEGDEVL